MIEAKIVVNVEPAKRLLKKYQKAAADPRSVLEGPIANRVHRMFERIFATAGTYIGSPWPKLAPSTIQQKAALGRANMGILRRFNTLWASLVKRSHPLGYRIVTPEGMLIGTSVPYAAAHQEGTDRVPRRMIVPTPGKIPAQELNAWTLLMENHLETAGGT